MEDCTGAALGGVTEAPCSQVDPHDEKRMKSRQPTRFHHHWIDDSKHECNREFCILLPWHFSLQLESHHTYGSYIEPPSCVACRGGDILNPLYCSIWSLWSCMVSVANSFPRRETKCTPTQLSSEGRRFDGVYERSGCRSCSSLFLEREPGTRQANGAEDTEERHRRIRVSTKCGVRACMVRITSCPLTKF